MIPILIPIPFEFDTTLLLYPVSSLKYWLHWVRIVSRIIGSGWLCPNRDREKHHHEST
jgi:hypothetical protein